ncbi:PREDICTED: protein FAM19A5-like, partial [Mesitornis unicolor]|uniref:protein FAM19A5-like n=1 Tax=Mesitornis unicolor TaxID=54374 RepID=UPI000528844A
RIIKTKQWCEMLPCLEGEGCDLLINKSGWTCTQPGGRIKTTTAFPANIGLYLEDTRQYVLRYHSSARSYDRDITV